MSEFKSLHLGEPKKFNSTIIYDGEYKWYELEYGMTEKEIISEIVTSLYLESGEIYFDKSEFLVSGKTKNGNIIFIEQSGEYNMYGGIYEPKMGIPKITVNDINAFPLVKEEFEKYGDYSEIPDISRVDIYGYILNNHRNFYLSKKFGI